MMEISGSVTEQIKQAAKNYPNRRSAIMSALYLAQKNYGCLTEEVLEAVANTLNVPEIWVFELATFYSLYHTKPIGKFHIQLCTNISCLLNKSAAIQGYIETRLQIQNGETTDDGKFTLSTVECLGSCDKAPALMVNETYYENLDVRRTGEILDQLNGDN